MQQFCPPQQNNRLSQSTQPSHTIELNGATLNQVDVSYNLQAGNVHKKAENKLAQSANTSGSTWPGVGQFTKQGDTLVFTPADNIQGTVSVTINGKRTEIQLGADLGTAAIRRNELAQPQRPAPAREIERPLPPPPAERKPSTVSPQLQQPVTLKFSQDFETHGTNGRVVLNAIPSNSPLHSQIVKLREQGLDIALSAYSPQSATFRLQSIDGKNAFQEIQLNPCAPGYNRNRDLALADVARKFLDHSARDIEQKLPVGTSAVVARVSEINNVLKSPALAQSMASLPKEGKGKQERWETYFANKIADINKTASEPVTPESVAKLNGLVSHLEKSVSVLQRYGHRPGVSTAHAEDFLKNNLINETALAQGISGSRSSLNRILDPISRGLSGADSLADQANTLLKGQVSSGRAIIATDDTVTVLKDGAIQSVPRETLSPAANSYLDTIRQRQGRYGDFVQLETKVAPLKDTHTNGEILMTPGGEFVLRAFNKETARLDHFSMKIGEREFASRSGEAFTQSTGKWITAPAQEPDFSRYMPDKKKTYVESTVEKQILDSGLHSTATAKVVEWYLSSSAPDASLNSTHTAATFDKQLMANQGQMKLAPQPPVLAGYWDSLLADLSSKPDHSITVNAELLNGAPVSHGSLTLKKLDTSKGPAIQFINH